MQPFYNLGENFKILQKNHVTLHYWAIHRFNRIDLLHIPFNSYIHNKKQDT